MMFWPGKLGFVPSVMDFKVVGCSESEEETDGVGFRDRGKRLSEVNARLLEESLGNQSGLVPLNTAIRVVLQFEDPFGLDWLPAWRQINQVPCIVVQK